VLRAIRDVNQLIAREKDRSRLLKGICDSLTESHGYYNAWVALLDESGRLIAHAESGLGADFLPVKERLVRGELTHCAQKALKQSGPVITENPPLTCSDCPLSDKYSGRGGMTIRLQHNGKSYGILSTSAPADLVEEEEECLFFQEAAGDIASALHNLELEERHAQLEHDVKERVKELECLYGIATIAEKPDITLDELYQEMANLLPSSWQYPEICCARITTEDKKFRTANYRDAEWKLCSDIKIGGVKAGAVEVNYLKKRPKLDEGPFSRDERRLIDAVATQMGRITERKKAEEALRQSEQKYRTILESVVEGYYETDIVGNFTLVNDSICHNMRYSRDELIGMNNRDYMDKQTAKKVFERYVEVYTTGQPARGFEFEVTRKDSTKMWVSSSVSLIRDLKGEPTGFRGLVRDITEEKQTEEMLRQSEKKYRTILENITDGYYEVDLAGNYTFFNDSMCEIVGCTKDEMIGMNNRKYMDKENARKVFQTFNKVYTTGKHSKGFDWELIRKDGTKRIVEASVSLIRNSQGEPAGFRGVVRDITERTQMEKEKEEMERKAQLATRLSTMGEMASGIVHEINNPLTSVVGFAEMLTHKDLPEDAREYATIINNEGKRVASIAGRLLNFARHQKPEIVYTDINKLIEDTLELQTYEMTTGNIKVTAKLDPHLPRTMADPGQLQQVFLNITLNARAEMRTAHGGGKLSVKTEAIDSTIRISIKDDGPGIPKENLKTIFNPFFTTRKKGEGTGLGLSICRGIISSHKGMIYVESALGKGATFIIELPVVARQRKTTQAGATIDKPRRPARVRT